MPPKSWYTHYFNTKDKSNNVGPIPDASYYCVNKKSDTKRKVFLYWYEGQKAKAFDNKLVQESYCQDDVAVLRQAFQVFRREFMQTGNMELFLEAITIACARNKVFSKRLLKQDAMGLILTGVIAIMCCTVRKH